MARRFSVAVEPSESEYLPRITFSPLLYKSVVYVFASTVNDSLQSINYLYIARAWDELDA